MSYVGICKKFVKKYGYITHKDILNITTANCSYGIMRSLKRLFAFEEIEKKGDSGKPYVLYLLRGEL